MSLPPGFLDELRSRTSLSQVAGRKVLWDNRKSNQAKGDMWAPCPFHQEKTASFHVDDRKGYYYCFGCHAKGDAITFVRETENVEFMEAVRILAGEAGMQMPERDPQAQEKADHLTQLAQAMEEALKFYRLQLKTNAGAAARDYLTGRGLKEPQWDQFEIGFAPDGWQYLWDHMTAKGIPPDQILECGLAKPGRDAKKPYDVFRNRILFPIRDPRGRCIAFGGRTMDPEDMAKYLNSPETPLFDKSRTLYNHGPAREAAGKGQPLIVAEGYMDVIALVTAGFGAALAPLGTAVTEQHLQQLWRISDEPVIALDGDTAGLRAAYRVIDLSLPLLEAGKSLRFALMPQGQDPDDVVRAGGPQAFRDLLDTALPMVNLLWQRETEGQVFDSPERKAALDKTLREHLKRIQDPSLRHHYGAAIKEMRHHLFAPKRKQWTPNKRSTDATPRQGTKASMLNSSTELQHLREMLILATCIKNPDAIESVEGALENLRLSDPDFAQIRDVLLRTAPEHLEDTLKSQIEHNTLEKLFSNPHVAIAPSVRHPDLETAQATLTEELAKLATERGLQQEITDAVDDISGAADETMTWRISQAAQSRNEAIRNQQEDKTEYEMHKTGARIRKDEKKEFDALMDQIIFNKNDH